MTRQDGQQRTTIDLCGDPVAAKMEIVERRTEIAVRITRNAGKIVTIVLGTVVTGLWSLYTVVEAFR